MDSKPASRASSASRKGWVVVVSASVALALSAAVAQAAVKTVIVASGNYAGKTSERDTVTFKIARREIINFSTYDGYNGSCGQGGGPSFRISVAKRNIPINAAGKFSTGITLLAPVPTVHNDAGTLTGTVAGGRVTGTIVNVTQEHRKFCTRGYNETFTAQKS